MGLSLLLLALVLFGASQGALKISFDALFDEEYRDIWLNYSSTTGFAGGAGRCSVGNRRGNYAGAFSQPNG